MQEMVRTNAWRNYGAGARSYRRRRAGLADSVPHPEAEVVNVNPASDDDSQQQRYHQVREWQTEQNPAAQNRKVADRVGHPGHPGTDRNRRRYAHNILVPGASLPP